MSKRWGFDLEDAKSALRHTIIPVVSGGAIAGIEAVTAGGASPQTVKMAVFTAIGSGIIGFLKRWSSDNTKG